MSTRELTRGTLRLRPERLRNAMDRRCLTVRALAAQAGISPTTIQTALRGEELVLRTVRAIALALEAIPEVPKWRDLVVAENDGDHRGGNPVIAAEVAVDPASPTR